MIFEIILRDFGIFLLSFDLIITIFIIGEYSLKGHAKRGCAIAVSDDNRNRLLYNLQK